MDTTVFLAQLWAPALLALGIGMFVSPSYYKRLYRDLEKETLALVTLAIVLIAGGAAHILAHNVWDSLAAAVVSLLGWGAFLKGLTFAIAPRFVDRNGDWAVTAKIVPTIGVVLVVVGTYLALVGYTV